MIRLNNHRHPAGLEWVILKKIPKLLLGAIVIPLFMAALVRLFPFSAPAAEIARHQMSIDILAIALCITALTALFTVTIGCIIVVLMKGPAYVADAYELEDSDRPRVDDDSE